MKYLNKILNLRLGVKSYLRIFLMLISFTFGYTAVTHLANEIKLLSSFSHEVKTLSIMGTLLLFFVMTDKSLFDQKSSGQNSASSVSGGGSSITKNELSHSLTNTELSDSDYDILNSQPVPTPIPSNSHTLLTLPIAALEESLHSPEFNFVSQQSKIDIPKSLEFNFDSQQSKIDISRVATVLVCGIIAVVIFLAIATNMLEKGTQNTLEYTNSTSNTLSIGLLAATFLPAALIVFDRFAKENPVCTVEKNQSAAMFILIALAIGVELKQIENITHNIIKDDWQNHPTYPLSPHYKSNEEQSHSD